MLPPLLILLAVSGAAAPPGATDPAAVLLARLREQYPQVERWKIEPLARGDQGEPGTPRVVQLGARSAVRSGNRLLWYAVAGYQKVVRATRWVPAGASIDARAGREAEADVLAAACEPVTDLALLNGSRTKRALRVDAVVCRDALEQKPPVGRGDEVTVRYIGHFVSLTTRAVALEDGGVGDSLNVRNIHHDDVFSAVVSGVDEVTVHE